MKMKYETLRIAALLPAGILAFTSCSTEPKGESSGFTAIQPGHAGGVRVETYQQTATVTGIDNP